MTFANFFDKNAPVDEAFFAGFKPLVVDGGEAPWERTAEAPVVTGRGGYRPNAGRKSTKTHKSATDETPDEKLTDYQKLERARAEKEIHLARQAKVKADLDEGRVVQIEIVEAICAQAFAAISQSLDSIADSLERKLSLDPKTLEAISKIINEGKQRLHDDLQKAYVEVTPAEEAGEDD